ncbi:MAG: hypothetical protein HOI15_19520 [Opitutales bacterium]|jgi:hypothetical protein|nr:hypothetical protein [Opitutales bacterium]
MAIAGARIGAVIVGLVFSFGLNGAKIEKIVEETIDLVPSPNNGASPLWCFGSSIFVRDADRIYLSLLRPDAAYEPSCNAHWEVWGRDSNVWEQQFTGGSGLEREPCPLGLLGSGELVLSIHPKFAVKPFQDGKGDVSWYCQPNLLGIDPDATDNDAAYSHYHPIFPNGAQFTQHSYRGMGIDRKSRDILLMVIDQREEHYQPSWKDGEGKWRVLPLVEFPIRSCYPQIALKDGAAHVLAIGDIVEPVEEWRNAKYRELGSDWDYVFRRLFYTWTPRMEESGFVEPIEIDSVDETGGHLLNLDLYLDEQNRAHLLYLKKPYQHAFMRDRYFPGEAMTVSLEYVVIDEGRVVSRHTLVKGSTENVDSKSESEMEIRYGRFHPLSNGSLGVIYSGIWGDRVDNQSGMFFSTISENGQLLGHKTLPVDRPITGTFFTNSPRSGSDVGDRLDVIGALRGDGVYEMRYLGFEMK